MRKSLITAAVALLLSIPAVGQFNSGGFYFSGATNAKLGFETTTTELGSNQNAICFGLTPEAGYFIRNRLAVGGAIMVDYQRFLGDLDYGEYDIVFGPSVRYYLPRDTDMQVFLYGFTGYGFVPNHNLFKFVLGPGINFFLTERMAFEAKLLYSFAREWNPEGGGHHNVHDFTVMAGISLFFPTFTFETFKRDVEE
ncbi:MAG: outer membrane beta-barrel protein [Bacteroidales bacterium]|nr:outer membrane beta-barrel protein [Bacteroidales bacterium]